MSIIIVICGTVLMALAVDTESFLHENLRDLLGELKNEGVSVPARTMVRKWPYWTGLFLIGAGTALNWRF
jgi:hypothetical protein